jgi:hypothetical protein
MVAGFKQETEHQTPPPFHPANAERTLLNL